jgi:hypothetical protein
MRRLFNARSGLWIGAHRTSHLTQARAPRRSVYAKLSRVGSWRWLVTGLQLALGSFLAALPVCAQEEVSASRVSQLPAQVSQQLEGLWAQSGESLSPITDEQRQSLLAELRSRSRADTTNVENVIESVSASARCLEGYVLQTRHRASAPDVEIVSEDFLDCDDGGCRAFQVVARGETLFDLQLSVTCS